MNGFKIVSEMIQEDVCVLLTGVSGAGKTTISNKIAKDLNLDQVIELDEVMRQAVLKKYPNLKGFWRDNLIEYFGDMEKAKKVMWENQLPAFKQTLTKYRKKPVMLEGMIVYYPQSNQLIESFTGKILVIRPTTPQTFLTKRIKYSEMEDYRLSDEQKKNIVKHYRQEVKLLKKFISKYKDRIELIDN